MANSIQKMKPERPCPACAAKMANFFAEKNGHRIFKCLACSSLFVSKLPSDTASIYGEKYFWGAESGFGYVDYDTDKEPMRKVFEQCVERISQISGRKGRLVDIGAATGYFMKLAKKMGWEAEGVEIGREAAEVGRRQGLKMLTATIAELSGAEKFDAITMFDVIEHVKDPEADLRKAHDLLKDDGALVIITPNSGSLYARLLGKRWHLIVPPEHLSYFTRAGMQTLLEKSGFQVIEMKAPGKWFTLEYILHTLLRWQGLGVWRGLLKGVKKFPRLANVRLPVNFRDNMLVFARKI